MPQIHISPQTLCAIYNIKIYKHYIEHILYQKTPITPQALYTTSTQHALLHIAQYNRNTTYESIHKWHL